MIELAPFATFCRVMTWGLGPIIASRTVVADCDAVRALLADPANQARLAAGRPGVTLEVKTPAPRVLKTEVRVRGRTVARATWILTAGRGSTEVDLALQLESDGVGSRLVGLLGGRWIARRLDAILVALATASARAAEDRLVLPAAAVAPAARARGIRAHATHARRIAVHR